MKINVTSMNQPKYYFFALIQYDLFISQCFSDSPYSIYAFVSFRQVPQLKRLPRPQRSRPLRDRRRTGLCRLMSRSGTSRWCTAAPRTLSAKCRVIRTPRSCGPDEGTLCWTKTGTNYINQLPLLDKDRY